jgi:hypothetical protein
MENSALTEQQMHDKLASLGDPTQRTATGIEKLTNMVEPLKAIENYTKAITNAIVPLAGVLSTKAGQDVAAVGGVLHAGADIAMLARALGMFGGEAAAAGTGAILGLSPVGMGVLAVGSTVLAYEGIKWGVDSYRSQGSIGLQK